MAFDILRAYFDLMRYDPDGGPAGAETDDLGHGDLNDLVAEDWLAISVAGRELAIPPASRRYAVALISASTGSRPLLPVSPEHANAVPRMTNGLLHPHRSAADAQCIDRDDLLPRQCATCR